jgi:hypothetical protein
MLSADAIASLHDQLTSTWHREPANDSATVSPADPVAESDWLGQVARQHRANFDLWHIEDQARVPGATDAELASVKRRIDPANQLRNDLAEGLDHALLAWLTPQELPVAAAPLHSETPGLMIDRLSILSLKIYHTREEAVRADAPPGHAQRNRQRLAILQEQRADLVKCLEELWRETLAGTRRFKIYRQLKMYNDPSLNPAIYLKPLK